MAGVVLVMTSSSPSMTTMLFQSSISDTKGHCRFRCTTFRITSSAVPISSQPRSTRDSALRDIHHSSNFTASLARSGVLLKVADLNIILRSFGKSKRWKDVSQLFDWMRQRGKINMGSYSSYMKFMTESKDVSRALNAFQSISDEAMRNNISICNSLLTCLVKNNMFDEAIVLFHQMKDNGLQPDVVTYSALLTGCLKKEARYTEALELLGELEDKGILMDGVLYGTLIAVCASSRKTAEAEMYFNRMKAEGHAPNMYHYSSLLNAYSTDGNYEKADKLVQDMKSSGLIPNKVVMTTLLKVYAKAGLLDKSRSLLSELETLGYATDEMPYCQLMDGLSKSGKTDEAEIVFNHMKTRQVRSDGYSHSIMISAFCRTGQLEKAKQLAMDYEGALYSKYDLVILNVLLCAYCRAGAMENVMQILKKMDTLAMNPDQKTFHILITYFIKEKLYLLAYRTLQDMHNKGHQLEEEVLCSLLLQLGKVGAHSEAFSVYNILRISGKAISVHLHEKILHILIAGHLFEEAYEIVKDTARLLSPLAVEKFLVAFTQSGNVDLISEVLEAVRVSGHMINQDVLHLAISRYIAQTGMEEEMFQLIQWISRHGFSIGSSTRNLILKSSNIEEPQLVAALLST